MKKSLFILTLSASMAMTLGVNAQVLGRMVDKAVNKTADKLAEALHSGSIVFTNSVNSKEKKKDANGLKTIDPNQPIFLSFYLNERFGNNPAFSISDGKPNARLSITSKDGKNTSFYIYLKTEDASQKFACYELAPATLSADNTIHIELANFFGSLSASVHQLTFSVGNEIIGEVSIDLSKGTGKFGALKNQIEEEKARKEEEEKKRREEEESKKKEAITAYQAASDAQKITFTNTGKYDGNLWVETGNKLTDFGIYIKAGQSAEAICRKGNKVYLDNNVISTIGTSSTVTFTAQRPKTAPGCSGSSRIATVYLKNETGRYLRYRISGDGYSGGGSIYKNSTEHINCCPYGYKLEINVIDEQTAQENSSNYKPYITITQDHENQTIVIR